MRIGLIGGSNNIKNQQSKAKDLYGFDNHFNSLFDYAQHVLKCNKILNDVKKIKLLKKK